MPGGGAIPPNTGWPAVGNGGGNPGGGGGMPGGGGNLAMYGVIDGATPPRAGYDGGEGPAMGKN